MKPIMAELLDRGILVLSKSPRLCGWIFSFMLIALKVLLNLKALFRPSFRDRLKEKTRKAVEKMAKDLLHLYAHRKAQKGFAFSLDQSWQKELEISFLYDETPDQLRTIEEVKRDMESETIMDRLVCGDVGFGKTEVALRAGFKAVMDGKQVALLVPTTVLAQQHFLTFKERLSPYPIEVSVLSRLRTKQQQNGDKT